MLVRSTDMREWGDGNVLVISEININRGTAQYVTVMTPSLLLLPLLLLISWVASSVCLSIERLPLQHQEEEGQKDEAQLISIAEHLRKEHLGISNFNPSVRQFRSKIQENISSFAGFTFRGSTSLFTEDPAPSRLAETVLRPDIQCSPPRGGPPLHQSDFTGERRGVHRR